MEKFQDDTVKLEMIKTILDGGYFNDNIYLCKMIKYNEEEECIYLLTGKTCYFHRERSFTGKNISGH